MKKKEKIIRYTLFWVSLGLLIMMLIVFGKENPVEVKDNNSNLTTTVEVGKAEEAKEAGDDEETVEVVLVVKNESDKPVTLTFKDGQRFDYEIMNEKGEVLKKYSDNSTFIMKKGEEVIEPEQLSRYRFEITDLPTDASSIKVWMTHEGKEVLEDTHTF